MNSAHALKIALAVMAAFVAAGVAAQAQDAPPKPAEPKPVEAPPAERPAPVPAPAARPADDAALRALLDEVAKLRAQVTELQKAQAAAAAAPRPTLVEKLDPNDPAAVAARTPPPAPPVAPPAAVTPVAPPAAQATTPPNEVVVERVTYVERDVPVPVYYEAGVPVYVRSDLRYSDCDDTLVGEWYPSCASTCRVVLSGGCTPTYRVVSYPRRTSWSSGRGTRWSASVACAPARASWSLGYVGGSGRASFGGRCAPRATSFRSTPRFQHASVRTLHAGRRGR